MAQHAIRMLRIIADNTSQPTQEQLREYQRNEGVTAAAGKSADPGEARVVGCAPNVKMKGTERQAWLGNFVQAELGTKLATH
jgi:hypothetical protein